MCSNRPTMETAPSRKILVTKVPSGCNIPALDLPAWFGAQLPLLLLDNNEHELSSSKLRRMYSQNDDNFFPAQI